jgi:hypothetical protein
MGTVRGTHGDAITHYNYSCTCFLYGTAGPNAIDAGKSYTRALEGVDPEDLDFFGSQNGNEQSDCHLGQKKIEILKNKGPKILSKITK